jgi:hypothetical protein
MMRTVFLLTSLFVAACTVGEIGSSKNTGTPDAGGTTTDAAPTGNGCINRVAAVDPAYAHGGAGGPTHAGESCVVAGCHLANNPGPNAPGWQFAGTVYKTGGTVPSAGATVQIKSAAGMTVTAITDDAGNFHIGAGMLPNPFPATATTTACPTLTPMVSPLAQGGGDCNGGGSCHGGTAGKITLADL